jgi:carbon monoxide dehydrogenase subunit G
MRFEATVNIEAPVEAVWQFIQNLPALQKCAGIDPERGQVRQEADGIWAEMTMPFAGMALRGTANLTWTRQDPPSNASMLARIWVRRLDMPDRLSPAQSMPDQSPAQSPAGSPPSGILVSVHNDFSLAAIEQEKTRLVWQGEVELPDALRSFPPAMLRAAVTQQSQSFFGCMKRTLEAAGSA